MDYIDRDLAWLSFNSRVLEQAEDSSIPALERLRFLSIFQSNLDEFYMKRISLPRAESVHNEDHLQTIKMQEINADVNDQLTRAKKTALELTNKILPSEGLHLLSWNDLTDSEKKSTKAFFRKNILPVLTPLGVDPGHPFPHISSQSTSLAVKMTEKPGGRPLFARIKIPKMLSPFVRLDRKPNTHNFLPLSELIIAMMSDLFPGMNIEASLLFRIVRNIEFERDEDEAEDILEMIANELRERKFGHTVKFRAQEETDEWLITFLKNELGLYDFDVFSKGKFLDYTDFNFIYKHGPEKLKFSKWKPLKNENFIGTIEETFSQVKKKDLLLHHPYESFKNSIEKVIAEASEDPMVLGIKVSLYRTNQNSRLIQSLVKAVENGKEVVCVIELKARLDEENNISWAQTLERAGAHIVYGMVGLKTHCKIALITRKEESGVECYAHIGTGNYNADTAAFYTDLGLLTANSQITSDVVSVFHFLTGRSLKKDYKKLLVAPVNLRASLEKMIKQEIIHAQNNKPAEIAIKLNNLEDKRICDLLKEAASAGVKIRLAVRSICVLPASQNIEIHSIVDQFLEHSRVFYFRNGADKREAGLFYMGSADLMTRNLDRRVEVLTPIEDPKLKAHLTEVLELFFKDNTQKWMMDKNGVYSRSTLKKSKNVNFQLELRRLYLKLKSSKKKK